jgi:tetratricopeptide (TPR) repeat protein
MRLPKGITSVNKIKSLIVFLFATTIFCNIVETKQAKISDKYQYHNESDCDSLNKIATKLYGGKYDYETIKKLNTAADCYINNKDFKKAGYTYLNIATYFDDRASLIDSSIIYLDKSLSINADSFHRANVLKYYGLTLGKKFKLNEALVCIDSSRRLFVALGNMSGEAVVDFDAAQVYFMNGKLDSCDLYLEKSKNYWKSINANQRVFAMNTFGMKLAHKKNNITLLKRYISENDSINNIASIHKSNLDSFNYYKTLLSQK